MYAAAVHFIHHLNYKGEESIRSNLTVVKCVFIDD